MPQSSAPDSTRPPRSRMLSPAGGAAPLATPLVSLLASERAALPLRVADSQGKVERLKTLLDEFNQVA